MDRPSEHRRSSVSRPAALVLLALILLSTARIGTTLPNDPQVLDAAGYVASAENIARFGVYGDGETKGMTSAPLLSAVIGLALRIDPRHADFRAGGEVTDHRAVRQVNLLFILVFQAGLAATALALRGTAQGGVGLAVSVLLLNHVLLLENPGFTHESMQELPTAAILTWANFVALIIARRGGSRWAFALGALGGLLTLSRAIFLYVFPLFFVLLLLLVRDDPRRRLTSLGAGLLGLMLVAGPWLARNVIEFDSFRISGLGSVILLIRDVKNDMTPYQHRGAWVYFSPEPLRPPLARVLSVDLDDFLDDGPLRPWVRWLPDPITGVDLESDERKSFYRQARDYRWDFVDPYLAAGLPFEEARELGFADIDAYVFANIRKDPLRFVRTAPVFLYRSTWPMNESQLWAPTGMTPQRLLLAAVNPLGMLALLLLGTIGLFRRRPTWFAMGGLATGVVAYHALFTHAIPRYSRPVAGVMILGVALGALWFIETLLSSQRTRSSQVPLVPEHDHSSR